MTRLKIGCFAAALLTCLAALTGCATHRICPSGESDPRPRSRSEAEIRAVLTDQAAAWNRGDIDGFMAGYWNSPELTFSAGGKTERGWQATRDRYRARYQTQAQMGQLTFSDVEIRPLGADVALVLGRWRLVRSADAPEGNFSLVFQRIGGRWVIIHDHSSSVPATP